jgi:hypothetical protein
MFEWMAWTTPVAVFFGCIVLMLVGMTVWELQSPTRLRQGLPADRHHPRRPALHRPADRGLHQPGLHRAGREVRAVVFAGAGPSVWISFRAVDGGAGAGHAQGLSASRPIPARMLPRGRSAVHAGRGSDTYEEIPMKMHYTAVAFAAACLLGGHAWAGEAEAKKWIDSEFQPSTLSKDQQRPR